MDVNKDIFTIKLPFEWHVHWKTLSISHYVNPDGQEVIILTVGNNNPEDPTREVLKAYIHKRESWSEIKTDC